MFFWQTRTEDVIFTLALLHFVISLILRPRFLRGVPLSYAMYFVANPATGTTIAIALLSKVETVGQLSWSTLYGIIAVIIGYFIVDSRTASQRWAFVLSAGFVLWGRVFWH